MHLFNIQVSTPVASPAQEMWIGPKKTSFAGDQYYLLLLLLTHS